MTEFARRMDIVASKFFKATTEGVKKAAVAADQEAVMRTPVATGRCRANWIVSTRGPSSRSGVKPTQAGAKGSEQRGEANARKTIEHGRRVIEGWKGEGSIFITNNVEYAPDLDRGTSAQAPDGMTEHAIRAAERVIRRHRTLKGL